MNGWIKLHRKILNNDLWTSEPFTKGQAWVDLLLLADMDGTISMTPVELSARWKWSRFKVYRFLAALESDEMIAHNIRTESAQDAHKNRTNFFYIIKWKEYQGENGKTHNSRTTSAQKSHNNRTNDATLPFYNIKNIEEEKKEETRVRATPPTKEEVLRFLETDGQHVNIERFYGYYEKKGFPEDWQTKAKEWETEEAAKGGPVLNKPNVEGAMARKFREGWKLND